MTANPQPTGLVPPAPSVSPGGGKARLPLRTWSLELARRWNGGTYSVLVLHGNIFDVFPVQAQNGAGTDYVLLKRFLVQRLFPERACVLFYDIGDGLTFGSSDMQRRFFEWLEVYDQVENTSFHQSGPPREFIRLGPLLRRLFMRLADVKRGWPSLSLIIDFQVKIISAQE